MIAHDYQAGPFYPTQLQPQYDGMTFSPINSVLHESQTRILAKTQEMLTLATSYLAATMPNEKRPSEHEIKDFIEKLVESSITGVDVLNAFNAETRAWMIKTTAPSPEWIPSWQRICQGLIQAGAQELALGDFLLWQVRVQDALETLRRIDAAYSIEPGIPDIVAQVSSSVQSYANRSAGEGAPTLQPGVEAALSLFLTQWTHLLKFGSAAEIHLNTCRLWAEHFAPRFEFGVPEWQFVLASLDLHIRNATGATRHRVVSGYLETLHEAASRFAFCGVLYRRLGEVETVLDPHAQHLPFKWQELVQEMVGEIVWAGASSYSASPICTRLLQGVDVLGGVKSEEFRSFAQDLVNCCRPLCERNWLDWLDASLNSIQSAIEYSVQRLESGDALKAMIQVACENLREGREAFASHVALSYDLEAMLDAAFSASRLHPDISDARRHFRSWFVLSLLMRRSAELWRHAQTLVRALGTGAKQMAQRDSFMRGNLPAIELLSEVVSAAPQAEWLAKAWAEISKVIIESEAPSCQRDVQWVLRKCALELVHSGQFRAAQAVANWMLSEVLPYVPSITGERFEQTYGEVKESLTRGNGALASESFTSVVGAVSSLLPGVLASHRIWHGAEGFGNEVARRVYLEMPEYAKTTGIGGAATCARDNGLTLRRIALALEPGRTDPSEFLGEWWANLINTYVVNRPAGLFRANCDAMLAVCAEQLSPAQTRLIEGLVRPLFESASVDAQANQLKLPPFQRLAYRLPFEAETSANPAFSWSSMEDAASAFFKAGAANAAIYASRLETSAVTALPHLMPKLTERLASGFPAWRWSGSLNAATAAGLRDALEIMPGIFEVVESLLHGWMQHTDTLQNSATALSFVAYIQECIEFNRQCFAGLSLSRESANLGRLVADAVQRSIPTLLTIGVSSAKVDRCGRDLAIVLKTMGEGMSTLPRIGALFNIQRCVAEQIAPHVGYGEAVWRMVWMIASRQCAQFVPAAAAKELAAWFELLEPTGRDLPWLGMINRRLLLGEEPQFSSDPQEEWEWRKTVSALLVMHRFHPLENADSQLLRGVLCASLPLLQTDEFGERLEAIAEAFKVWFVDVEVGEVVSSLNAFQKLWEGSRKLSAMASQVPEINERLSARLPFLASCAATGASSLVSLNWFTFQSAWAALGGGWQSAGNRWGTGSEIRVVQNDLLPLFGSMDADAISSWATALGNAFSAVPLSAQQFGTVLSAASRTLADWDSVNAVWSQPWSIVHDETAESCARDLRWLARRLAVDSLSGRSVTARRSSGDWFLHEILPYAGTVSMEVYLPCFRALADAAVELDISTSFSAKAAEFHSRVAGILASHLLNAGANNVAEVAMERFRAEQPDYYKQLSAEKQGSCFRDTALTIHALADAISEIEPAPSLRVWWQRTVAPYLSPKETPILGDFRESILDAIGALFEVPVSERSDAELADLSGTSLTWSSVRTLPHYDMGAAFQNALGFLQKSAPHAIKYASDTTGVRPGSVARLTTVLSDGFAAFSWDGVLSANTTAHWCAALTSANVASDGAERFLLGLMQQAGRGLPAVEALGLVHWLQELVEFNRQCTAGLFVSQHASRLAAVVGGHLAKLNPAEFGGPAASGVGHALRRIFKSLGRSMSRVAKPVAVLRTLRSIVEEVLPLVALSEKGWRFIWISAAQEAETVLPASALREFSTWCELMEKCGSHLSVAAILQRRLADNSAPRLVADADTDGEIRALLTLCVALSLLPGPFNGAARTVVVGSLAAKCPELLAKAATAWLTIKNEFPDLDLVAFEQELGQLTAHNLATQKTVDFLNGLPEWHESLAKRLPLAKLILGESEDGPRGDGLCLLAHTVSLAALGAPLEGSNRWAVPHALAFCHHSILAELGSTSEAEIKRLVGAMAQLGSLGADVVKTLEGIWLVLQKLGAQLPAMEAAWQAEWAITPPAPKRSFFGFGGKKDAVSPLLHASCSRDLAWAARRIALDGWVSPTLPRSGGEKALDWYAGEIMPFAGAVANEEYQLCANALDEGFAANRDVTPSQREAAAAFRHSLSRNTASLGLLASEDSICAEATKTMLKRVSRNPKGINDAQKREMERDIRLTIREVAKAVAMKARPTESFRRRIAECIEPRLALSEVITRADFFAIVKDAISDSARDESRALVYSLLESL